MSFHGPHNAKGWYPFTPHAPMPNILCEYHAKTTIDSIESEHIYDIRYTFQLYSIARVLDDRISRPPGVHEISQCSCSSGIGSWSLSIGNAKKFVVDESWRGETRPGPHTFQSLFGAVENA
jgi:hypothetical protein